MATFSPASSVSNDSSFYTAVDSHYGSKSTTASSPVYENASPYDDARPLPSELRDHCHIFLDEKLCESRLIRVFDAMIEDGPTLTVAQTVLA